MSLKRPTRRDIFKIAAAAPALALPAPLQAALSAPSAGGNPGYFRFDLGEMRLTVISDGHLLLPTSGLGVNAEPEEVQALLARYHLSTEENYSHTNHLLIETGAAKVLVDIGSGNRFMPTAGRLMANLEAAGVDPYSITHVVITHAHPDHVWGVRDDFDEAILPDAEFIMGRAEHDYWMQDGLATSVSQDMQQFVVGAVNSITTEGLDWTLAEDGHEVVPGVRLIFTPGHTLGHMSVQLDSGDRSLIALGDTMTHAYMNFDAPDWVTGFDMDAEQTVATRRRLLDMAAEDGIAVLGYHFPFPGVGHVIREGAAYRFVPALWRWQG